MIAAAGIGAVTRALGFGTATLHEAGGQIGALPSAIKPVHPSFQISGRALTVLSPQRDNLWLHKALAIANPGDVLVVETGGYYEAGYWGEIMSHAGIARQLAGVVIDGCVRDSVELAALGLPVFARGLCIRGTTKDYSAYGALNVPIRIGDCVIEPGDLVRGDGDGVVILPASREAAILDASEAREAKERDIIAQLKMGKTSMELYKNFQ